ncbi:hypothetical protein IGI04_023686, partial [Brassica rapa subsp. trilocularis]
FTSGFRQRVESACRCQRVSFFYPRFRICFIVPALLYQSCCWPWSDVSPDAREVVDRGGILVGAGVTTRWNRAIVCGGVSFSRLRVTCFLADILCRSLEPSRSKCVDEVRFVSVLVLMVGVSSRLWEASYSGDNMRIPSIQDNEENPTFLWFS